MIPDYIKMLPSQAEYPEQFEAATTLINFYAKYNVGIGVVGDGDCGTEVETFLIPHRDFKGKSGGGDFRKVIASLPKAWSDEDQKELHLFSRFNRRYPVFSQYDCTGQLIGCSKRVDIINDGFYWLVFVRVTSSYDL